jgi:hypothetical protein
VGVEGGDSSEDGSRGRCEEELRFGDSRDEDATVAAFNLKSYVILIVLNLDLLL